MFACRTSSTWTSNFVDVELITEPAEVLRYAQVRDAASHYAVPYEEFEVK
ncbi:DUF6879 family protein [Streptomyces sp. NPDC002138]